MTEPAVPITPEPVTPAPAAPAAPEPAAPAVETYTKAQLDAAAAAARKADKEELKAGEAAIAELAELKASKLMEDEKKDKLISELTAQYKTTKAESAAIARNAMTERIAVAKGVPAAALPFTRFEGDDEATIGASVDAYLAALPATPAPGTRPGGDPSANDINVQIASATDPTEIVRLTNLKYGLK